MSQPCDKGPDFERLEKKFDRLDIKIDKISEQLVSAAVLAEAHKGLQKKVSEIDTRLMSVEEAPRKAVGWAIASAIAAAITLLFSHWGSQ